MPTRPRNCGTFAPGSPYYYAVRRKRRGNPQSAGELFIYLKVRIPAPAGRSIGEQRNVMLGHNDIKTLGQFAEVIATGCLEHS